MPGLNPEGWPWAAIGVATAAVLVLAVAGALLTRLDAWYYGLRQPAWKPPDWLFGPAWMIIFTLAAIAAVRAWQLQPEPGYRAWFIVLFGLNGVLNMGWSWLFFTLRRPDWALAEVVPLWLSVLALMLLLHGPLPLGWLLLLPYLVWVAYAATINLAIVRDNGPFGRAAR
jgi:tryptophan-rich sensory protein